MEINKENYHFASGSIEDFLTDYNQPKNEAVDNSAEINLFEQMNSIQEDKIQETPTEPQIKVTKTMAHSAAESAAGFLEMASDIGNGLIHKSEENRLSDHEREKLESSFETYFLTYGIKDIPPSWLLVFTILMIFAPKTFNAIQRRKEKTQIEKQQAKIAELQAKVAEYEKQQAKSNE